MMLSAKDICVQYGKKTAVHQVSLSLHEGVWLMVVGPNGAGKSSLLSALSQTVRYQGEVLVHGENAQQLSSRAFAKQVAVLSQKHSLFYAFSVEELVSLGRYAHQGPLAGGDPDGSQLVEEALSLTGLMHLRHQNALTLSGGELQRAYLAQVFAQDASMLLLDEPASFLDMKHQRQLFDLIQTWLKTPGRAVLSVVHDLALARRYGNQALLMRDGKALAVGQTEQVLTSKNLELAYDMDVNAHLAWLMKPWEHGL